MPNTIVTRPPIRRRGQNWFPFSYSQTKANITGTGGVVIGGRALVDLSVPQVASDVVIEWDFDNDGDFSESVEDITSYVLACETGIGRDWPSQLTGKSSPGQLRITLNNDDDRFSFFNEDSPLNAGDFSLRTGRKIRLRTSDAASPEPALLARDRFNRANFAPQTETGQTWIQPLSAFATEATTTPGVGGANATVVGAEHIAVVDVADTDYYVQVKAVEVGRETTEGLTNIVGLIFRYQDVNNFSAVWIIPDDGELWLVDVVGGSFDIIDSSSTAIRDNITIGVLVSGAEVKVFESGVQCMATNTAIQLDETGVGIYAQWSAGQPTPVLDDFYVWEGLPTEVDGILWTGYISSISASVEAGPHKLAILNAEGVLARAAAQATTDPVVSLDGRQTGAQIGNTLAAAGLMNLPSPINILLPGDVVTGPFYFEKEQNVLELCRKFEDVEVGFLYETQEGYFGYQSRSTRDDATSQVTFSDNPGAQFGYTRLAPLDSQREVFNRASAGLAQQPVGSVVEIATARTTSAGVANPIDIVTPVTVQEHDLVIHVIASSVRETGEDWATPLWWKPERTDIGDSTGLRIYTHITAGDDGGETVRFYNDTLEHGGAWWARTFLIHNWYGLHEGINIAEVVKGNSPSAIFPPWGAVPTMFLAIRFGAVDGGTITDVSYPLGYTNGITDLQTATSTLRDVALQTAWKRDITPVEDPGGFAGFGGFVGPNAVVETTVIAIRGLNGSVPPPMTGVLTITGDDVQSQEDHNAIRTLPTVPELFDDETDAEDYIEFVLARYSDDRPIFSMTFFPVKGNHYRQQAIQRRINDKITLRADANTGMGVNGDFFIEKISHRFSQGTTYWETTWELSPA